MSDALQWVIVIGAVLCLIGLASYARGPEHYRGDQVGSHGTKVVVVRTEER
jgi:hypothetical protein